MIENSFKCFSDRPDLMSPNLSKGSTSSDTVDLSGNKKVRRFYSIVPENWNFCNKIGKKDLEQSEESYVLMASEEDLESKKVLMEGARAYIQAKFRTMEVPEHVYALKNFWKLPNGTQLLSSWFQWLTGGSDSDWLEANIDKNLEPVLLGT